MTMPRAILAAFAVWAAAPALAADPPVPLGQDAGGTAVAFMTTGIDYRDPAVAKALARDGEGELIGWDFVDDDNHTRDVKTHRAVAALTDRHSVGRNVGDFSGHVCACVVARPLRQLPPRQTLLHRRLRFFGSVSSNRRCCGPTVRRL